MNLLKYTWTQSLAAIAVLATGDAHSGTAGGMTPALNSEPAATAIVATPREGNPYLGDGYRADARPGMMPGGFYGDPAPEPSEEREAIENKLRTIVFDQVHFDGVPLPDVLKSLDEETRKRDPRKQGINFLLNPNGGQPGVDPLTGAALFGTAPEPVDLSNVFVTFNLPLRNVRLKDLLDAVVKVADCPLRYSVEEYGVVFSVREHPAQDASSFAPAPGPSLEVRTFRVDTNTFVAGLESTFGVTINQGNGRSTSQVRDVLQDVFAQLGIDMNVPGKAVFYNPLAGVLMVRATGADLDVVQAAVETIGGNPPAYFGGFGGGYGGVFPGHGATPSAEAAPGAHVQP